MQRRLPPFAAIRAFEATARHGSVKDAADELCLTASAVSHQIKSLEEFLSTGLFVRQGNRLELTLTGRGYAGKLTGLLDSLDDLTGRAKGQGGDLRILCTPGFAARWLVPRLDRFPASDRVRLRVSVGAPDTDFDRNDADVVIHWGDSPVPGAIVSPLMASARYPVVAPDLKQQEAITTPDDLSRMTLLHDDVMDGWEEWFRVAGVAPPDMPRGPSFPNCEFTTTAAERGLGVALAYDAMVRGTLDSGSLVRLFDTVTMPVVLYSVAYPAAHRDRPLIRAFRDWIFAEARNEQVLAQDTLTATE